MTKRSIFAASILLVSIVTTSVVGARGASAATVTWYEDTPTSNPPFQTETAVAYDATSNQLVAFGGAAGTSYENSTWVWDGSDWTELNLATSPADRAGASIAYDESLGELILFGGVDGSTYYGDTWAWNGNTWSELSTNGPTARAFASMSFDSESGQIILYGGIGSGGTLNDTWSWSGTSWTQVASTGPPALEQSAMTYDSSTHDVVLFGGSTGSSTYGDTWAWNGSIWSEVATTGPSSRDAAAITYDTQLGAAILYGGSDGTSALGDTWEWNGSSWLEASTTGPAARTFAGVAYDSASSQVVLVGGNNGSNFYDDTWIIGPPTVNSVGPVSGSPSGDETVTITGAGFTGATEVEFGGVPATNISVNPAGTEITVTDPPGTAGDTVHVTVTGPTGTSYTTPADQFTWFYPWYMASPSSAPTPRYSAQMGYDPATVQLIEFGGFDFSTDLNDTWDWNGNTWTELSPAQSPPARKDASMAFDPSMGSSGELLLFGGISGSTYLDDMWAWNGTTWTSIAATGPVARANASMAYDPDTSQMLLFGGENSAGALGDTWTWNGSSWSPLSPSPNPGTLESASLAYDTSSSQLVLFGGYDGSSDEANTWEWTGTAWDELSPTSSPPATDGSPMVYDPDVSSAVLFEASTATTWTWDGTDWAQVTPTTSPSARTDTSMAYDSGTAQIVLFGGDVGGAGNTDTWVVNPPGVTAISPSAGPTSNDTPVDITGTGFTGATAVDFGTTAATSYTIDSGNEITASPPGGSGPVDVTVTNPDGTSTASSNSDYSYDPVPAVTSVAPDAGIPGGGNSVNVEGTNLMGATTVAFGTNATTNITVDTSSQLTVNTVPAGTVGSTVDITVTTPGGTSAVNRSADGYTYEDEPTISSMNPHSGPVAGGTVVTITGSGFTDATRVDFGSGHAGTSVDVVDSATLTVVDPSHSAGTVQVTITSPLGQSAADQPGDVFTYLGVPPSPPLHLHATSTGCSVLLSWTRPSNTGSSSITGYEIFVGTSSAGPLSGIPFATTSTTSYHLYGLDCGAKYYLVVRATNLAGAGPVSNEVSAVLFAGNSPCVGRYWEDASDGGVFSFGRAKFYGSMGGRHLNEPMVGMAATPDCKGYWLVASDGGVFSFGDATFYGSMGAHHLNKPIVGMESTPDGKGYWLVASDGGIFSFGDAAFFGSTGSLRLNAPVVAMEDVPNGTGYWLVASDGGVFSFGAARFHGSMGSHRLSAGVVGIATTPDGGGYWFVSANGDVFSFGNADYHGSNLADETGVIGIATTLDGNGYWLVATDGGIFSYGDAQFYGSMGGRHLNEPIVGMTA
jgi:hypothetical protein